MINQEVSKKIKDILGFRYSAIILKELSKSNIKNRYGKEFLPQSIQKIVNGENENTEVESIILKLVQRKKKAIEKNNQLAQKL